MPPSPVTAPTAARARGFTLIELVLVLAILSTVLAVAAPSLARFFRGRNLDSEAYRLVALSRYGQSRAAAEGIPMLLWLDEKNQRYGLQADPVWTRQDPREVAFELPEDVVFEIRHADLSRTNSTLEVRDVTAVSRPTIRFMPDGSFGPSSPEWIELRGRNDRTPDEARLWISPGWNRLYYEIWTNQPPNVRS